MNFFGGIFLLSIIVLLGFLSPSYGGACPVGWITCLNQNVMKKDRIDLANSTCQTDLKDVLKLSAIPTKKEIKKTWKNKCFMACIWEKLGIISNGVLNTTGITNHFSATYQPAVAAVIIDGVNTCGNLFGTGLMKTDECKSYKSFTNCTMKVIKHNCKFPGQSSEHVNTRSRRDILVGDFTSESNEDNSTSIGD